jgi:hypothetical protein
MDFYRWTKKVNQRKYGAVTSLSLLKDYRCKRYLQHGLDENIFLRSCLFSALSSSSLSKRERYASGCENLVISV